MTAPELSQLVLLYSWFALAALLFFLVLIARFYEKFSGERTYFRWLVIPAALFGIATVRYVSIDIVTGDPLADGLMGLAGVILIVLCISLYHKMTVGRSPNRRSSDHPEES